MSQYYTVVKNVTFETDFCILIIKMEFCFVALSLYCKFILLHYHTQIASFAQSTNVAIINILKLK